jgi:hypothetical protein
MCVVIMCKARIDELQQFLKKLENMNHLYTPPADFTFSGEICILYILLKVRKNIFLVYFNLTVIGIYPTGPPNCFPTAIVYVFIDSSRQDTATELLIYGLSDCGWNWFSLLKSQELNLTL